MIDETGKPEWSSSPTENAGQTGTERVGFCQQCGRELTAATVRRAGSAVFCEPCLIERLGAATADGATGYTATGSTGNIPNAGAQATGSAGQVPPPPPPPPGATSPIQGEPNPGLAALLGLIPGVGAMYNGQYAKGVAHLVVFAVLVSLADNVNGVFGLLVTGWIFYQAFEAYHTAKARRDGTSLPNPFGLNDIGDRMGFGKNWPGSAGRPVSTAPFGWNNASTTGPNWAGYVPPTNFGATATPPPPAGPTTSAATPGNPTAANTNPWSAAGSAVPPPPPYSATYAGEPWHPGAPPVPPVPPLPPRRFPAGAIWLIGLGVLFLLSNLDTAWHIRGHWLLPIGLAALAAWMLYHRISWLEQISHLREEQGGLGPQETRMLVCQLRGPVFLLVLAVLFALQAASVFTFGQTWPVLFIILGLLLILERTAGGGWAGTVDPSVSSIPPIPPASASAWPPKEGQ